MTNRTKSLNQSPKPIHQDPLEALLDSCHRNGRKALLTKPQPKIFFDAERFRWFFRQHEGKTLAQWRDLIDTEMRKEL